MTHYPFVGPNEVNEIARTVWNHERHRRWPLIEPEQIVRKLAQAAVWNTPERAADAMELVLLLYSSTVPRCDDPHDAIDPRRL